MCNHISEEFLTNCGEYVIDLAIRNVKAGGLPFAAIIVNQNGEIIGKGVNQVAKHLDCTAHAEIQAIREASRNEKNVSLKGMTLIASGEPCTLCYMAIRMANIMNVIIVAEDMRRKNRGLIIYGPTSISIPPFFMISKLRRLIMTGNYSHSV